jgi:hypothetical protein
MGSLAFWFGVLVGVCVTFIGQGLALWLLCRRT